MLIPRHHRRRHDARKNHAIAREIKRELGLEKVTGPYDREPDAPRL
jgi:hypothetical protein